MNGRIYWLASYPKSGNTWFRAFMANLRGEAAPSHDEDEAASINELRTGGIASSRGLLDDMLGFDTADLSRDEIADLRPVAYRWMAQRCDGYSWHKIHDACVRVPSGDWLASAQATAGALYLIRNPLDVAISYANHSACSIDQAIDHLADPEHCLSRDNGRKLASQVEQRMLTWSEHVESWVDNPDIAAHVVRYEDMLGSPQQTFGGAAQFLQLENEPEKVARAIRLSSFDGLRSQEDRTPFVERNPKSPVFFRKGIAGDWQQTLDSGQIDRIVTEHGAVMRRFGYLDAAGEPKVM